MVRALLVLVLLFATGLSGCTGDDEPNELLIRFFREDVTGDGAPDAVFRVGALTPSLAVQPFDGRLEILVFPVSDTSTWMPRSWTTQIRSIDFVDAKLPYAQITRDGGFIPAGDQVDVFAEAVLDDGRRLAGSYRTTA